MVPLLRAEGVFKQYLETFVVLVPCDKAQGSVPTKDDGRRSMTMAGAVSPGTPGATQT